MMGWIHASLVLPLNFATERYQNSYPYYVATQNTVEMSSSVRSRDQTSEMEESQMTTLTLVTSQGPAAAPNSTSASDIADEKLNELHRAFSISPSHSTDYIEMSGAATGKKMGKAERNLLERSATSLSSHSSIGNGGTPKRAKYNPYHYDSLATNNSTAHQTDSGGTADQDQRSTAAKSKKSDQESTSSGAAAATSQNGVSAANGLAGVGGRGAGSSGSVGTTAVAERLCCNGKEDGGKVKEERVPEPDTSG